MFSPLIREGRFDSYLSKPVSPLFRSLMGHPDLNDAMFLLPMIGVSLWIVSQLQVAISLTSVLWYLVMLLNGFSIALGLHILVMSACIILVDVDSIIWLYRDLLRLGQFPVTVYQEPLRSLLYFVMPVALMVTIPTQGLLGDVGPVLIFGTLLAGVGFFGVSLYVWKLALRQYSGAGG